jgi:hypothetical protein
VGAGVNGRGASPLARAGGAARAGGDLAAADGAVQGDDVLGVDEPGGAGPADRLAGVIARPPRAGGAGGDDGQHPAGPQHPLARREQRARSGSRLTAAGPGRLVVPGDGQGRLPGLRVPGLQEQGRAAGPDLGEPAQPGIQTAQARQDPLAGTRARSQARTRRPAAAAAATITPSRAPGMTTSSPGRENAVMICAASGPLPVHEAHSADPGPGPLPGTGACGQMLTGTPIPGGR